MAKVLVDARGRSCPEPVLMTKRAIDSFDGKKIEVLVDAIVAVENVKRVAQNTGFTVDITENGDEYTLLLNK